MRTFILVLHLMLTLSMIVVILFQRSEGAEWIWEAEPWGV